MKLTLEILTAAVGNAAALRSITRLQPVGGKGDKVFPATFEQGKYALEKRRLDPADKASEVDCALLDSVASQANRAEEALLAAIRSGKLKLPLIEVDFTEVNPSFQVDIPKLTSLEVPHRLADAILRDSELPDGTRFSASSYAQSWRKASPWNARAIYELCPTALLFGMWGSPEKPGGLGAKFERAYVSEIVAVDITKANDRKGYRIDPIAASSSVLVEKKVGEVGYKVVEGKKGLKPSEINHSNIPYSTENAGVQMSYAEQTTVISFGALRKLRFGTADVEGRTVLAAIGLCGATLAAEQGTSLRSRCQLWPETERKWELLDKPGIQGSEFTLSSEEAISLLKQAVAQAEQSGLVWNQEIIQLRPTKELATLIEKSQIAQANKGSEDKE